MPGKPDYYVEKVEDGPAKKAPPKKKTSPSFITKVCNIQGKLKAPKNQTNAFGKYKYRSAEDILEAVKPLCVAEGVFLSVSDEIYNIYDGASGRTYVRATATITDGKDTYSVTAYAREEESKKGMDAAQVTGAASSYARKYALNGLFLIDDTKDADATNTHGKDKPAAYPDPIELDEDGLAKL